METHILQATQAERQRELDMLRSRFNENKEIARATVRSCVRTSESSEGGGGKPSSPKSSPICPVKPTPASVRWVIVTRREICANLFVVTINNYVLFVERRIIPRHLRHHRRYRRYLSLKSYRTLVKLLRSKDKVCKEIIVFPFRVYALYFFFFNMFYSRREST